MCRRPDILSLWRSEDSRGSWDWGSLECQCVCLSPAGRTGLASRLTLSHYSLVWVFREEYTRLTQHFRVTSLPHSRENRNSQRILHPVNTFPSDQTTAEDVCRVSTKWFSNSWDPIMPAASHCHKRPHTISRVQEAGQLPDGSTCVSVGTAGRQINVWGVSGSCHDAAEVWWDLWLPRWLGR